MSLSSFSSQQGVVQTAKRERTASQPPSGESLLAKRLALLARLHPRVLRKLMRDADPELIVQLTRHPEMIERLEQQPQALDEVVAELARQKPECGLSWRGVRRFRMGGALRISV
jgi:hypothetical protein